MVPLGTLLNVRETVGPDKVMHHNLYPSADINGATLPGVSSGQAIQMMEQICREPLPPQFGFEWTELSLQQILAGNSAVYIFPLCVVFVFLVLAALYESWALPASIILIVPMCLLAAITGVFLRQMDNNIFTQIGFVVLVGLACKNAILIGVTLFGIFLIPVFFSVIMKFFGAEAGRLTVPRAKRNYNCEHVHLASTALTRTRFQKLPTLRSEKSLPLIVSHDQIHRSATTCFAK